MNKIPQRPGKVVYQCLVPGRQNGSPGSKVVSCIVTLASPFPVPRCFVAFAAFCQTLPQGVQKVISVEGITEYAYPNGLHLLLFPDPSSPN